MLSQKRLDPAGLARPTKPRGERRADGAAAFVAEHQEERRGEMRPCVLQGAHHLGRHDVAGEPHHEEVAEAGAEDELGRHPRVAAPEDRRVGALLAGERHTDVGNGDGEERLPADEARVAFAQTCDCLLGGQVCGAHARASPARARPSTIGFITSSNLM